MRNVLVVGGAGGLGGALVAQLAGRGLGVAVAGRSPARDPRVRCSETIDARTVDWSALYERTEAALGAQLDAVAFVAGGAVYGRTALVPAQQARDVFELNFWALGAAAIAAAERWSGRGQTGATFLAVLSLVARRAVPFESHYAASKAAAARFLECLDLEYSQRGVRFVSACPGTVRTSFRRRAQWHGLTPPAEDDGASVERTAGELLALLEGRRRSRVIGWRERSIDLADRLLPGLYDRAVLRRRVRDRSVHGSRG